MPQTIADKYVPAGKVLFDGPADQRAGTTPTTLGKAFEVERAPPVSPGPGLSQVMLVDSWTPGPGALVASRHRRRGRVPAAGELRSGSDGSRLSRLGQGLP